MRILSCLAALSLGLFSPLHAQEWSGLELNWSTEQIKLKAPSSSVFPLAQHHYLEVAEQEGLKTAGLPQWPYTSTLVVGHADQIQVEIEAGEATWLAKQEIATAPLMPCRCEVRVPRRFVKGKHPLLKGPYMVEQVGDFRGIPISKVTLTPFFQNQEGTWVYRQFKARVRGAAGRFDFSQAWEEKASGAYLLVAPENFLSELGGFIEQLEFQGHEVRVLNYQGQTVEQLREQIHAHYRRSSFSYALIVGHEDLVPMDHLPTSADPRTPTDLTYFTMGGAEDRLPDVAYGRWVVERPHQIRALLSKMEEAREQRYQDASGLSTLVTLASNEGFNPTDVEYAEQMADPFVERLGYEVTAFIQGQTDSTGPQILERLNRGSVLYNYIGHGEGDRWPSLTGEPLTVDQFGALGPRGVKPLVIDVACQNGRLSLDRRIGERLMNHTAEGRAAGALFYYGGSVDISWHPPARMAVYINQIAAEREVAEIGPLLLEGQFKLLELYDDLPSAMENLIWYHLQGDPSFALDFR